jgi:hypothetical protein
MKKFLSITATALFVLGLVGCKCPKSGCPADCDKPCCKPAAEKADM